MKFSEALETILDSDNGCDDLIYERNGCRSVGKWYDDHMLKFEDANKDRDVMICRSHGRTMISVIERGVK